MQVCVLRAARAEYLAEIAFYRKAIGLLRPQSGKRPNAGGAIRRIDAAS